MRRQSTDPACRAGALRLAAEVGSAEAARRLGLKPATVRSWVHRQAKLAPTRSPDEATRKAAGAVEA